MTGGYSGPLNLRYAEKGRPLPSGLLCKRVEGRDATSLFPHAMRGDMPCRFYTVKNYAYETPLPPDLNAVVCSFLTPFKHILNGINSGSLFGFVKVDIHTPKEARKKFRGLLPIYTGMEVPHDAETIGPMMAEQAKREGRRPSKKLVNLWRGKGLLLNTPTLQWMIKMGLKITRIYCTVEFGKAPVFQQFVDTMSNDRRRGDIKINGEKPFKVLGDSAKLLLNSVYGKFLEDISKHRKNIVVDEPSIQWQRESAGYVDEEKLCEGYEVSLLKKINNWNRPNYLGIMVYQNSKLHMLKFITWVNRMVDPRKLFWMYTDTDCLYYAMSEDTLEECVKPELLSQFQKEKRIWFPQLGDRSSAVSGWDI